MEKKEARKVLKNLIETNIQPNEREGYYAALEALERMSLRELECKYTNKLEVFRDELKDKLAYNSEYEYTKKQDEIKIQSSIIKDLSFVLYVLDEVAPAYLRESYEEEFEGEK